MAGSKRVMDGEVIGFIIALAARGVESCIEYEWPGIALGCQVICASGLAW